MKLQINEFTASETLMQRRRVRPVKNKTAEKDLRRKKKQNVVSKFFSAALISTGCTLGGGQGDRAASLPHIPGRRAAKANIAPTLLGGPARPLEGCLKLVFICANTPLKAVIQMRPVWLMHAS